MADHPRANPIERAFMRDLAHFRKYGNTTAIRRAAEALELSILDHLDAVVRAESFGKRGGPNQ